VTETPQFVDLQVHTTASDGALSPTAVVEAARAAGLHAIALTDHDSLGGIDEAVDAGLVNGVRIVPGVELSTWFDDDELHLLGLHIVNRAAMNSALEEFRRQRVERAERIIATLNAHGIPVTMDAVMREAGTGALGRPHIARAMLAGGWIKEFREAFDKWIGWNKPAYMAKDKFAVEDAIELVHRAGGLAVWAHPGEAATPTRIERLAKAGLDSIEVLHPSHPPYLVQRLVGYTEQAGLLPSGGSDWHGNTDGPRRLGGQLVPKVWLDWQDVKAAERAAAIVA
jgi:predicted metal-dependent phosphoesterase TrpH